MTRGRVTPTSPPPAPHAMMDLVDYWLHGFPGIGTTAPWAARAESLGYSGVLLADSEILVADPYIECTLAGSATTGIGIGVAVTNPVSRAPAVTAAAIATVHAESRGRAVLGLGRGDSALRLIGRAPATVGGFTSALRDIRRYLGRQVDGTTVAPLQWMPPGGEPPIVDVAATGPRMIAVGAVFADRLTFNLGADPTRLAWAVEQAKAARHAAGLDPDGMSLGAYIDVACAPTTAEALTMVRGSASIFAHFLAEGMAAHVPVDSEEDRRVLGAVAAQYAEAAHGRSSAPQAELLPDDFLARFTLAGPADAIAQRVIELEQLGLDRIVVVPASRDVDPALVDRGIADFAAGVIAAH